MPTRPVLAVTVLAVALVLSGATGCSSSAAAAVKVTSSESSCEVSQNRLPAGTSTFSVTNKGNDVTEVYVYGAGDAVIGEVEDIGPGTTRDLKVKLGAGTYSVACKPGQKGDGIRTPLTVTD